MIHLSGDIWERWKRLHADLSVESKWDLASLFMGHEPLGFRDASPRTLFTGKATAGPLNSEDPGEQLFFCKKSAFWNFAQRVANLSGEERTEIQNVAWSNICKIGTKNGNPAWQLVKRQRELAIETLRCEWLDLKPTLVVCATENYFEDLIYEALGVQQNVGDGFVEAVSDSGYRFWCRKAMREWPAFLWMKHPQGKSDTYIKDAERLALEMLSEVSDSSR